jgi:hypothetical protein
VAQREVHHPADPRAPAVEPKSEEERRRGEVSVAELVEGYPGVPRPVKVRALREDADDLEDVDGW